MFSEHKFYCAEHSFFAYRKAVILRINAVYLMTNKIIMSFGIVIAITILVATSGKSLAEPVFSQANESNTLVGNSTLGTTNITTNTNATSSGNWSNYNSSGG